MALELQIWGSQANDPGLFRKNTVLAVKDCRVSLYQKSVTISPSFNSVFVANVENIPEARKLYEWYQSADLNEVQTLSGGGGEKQFNSLYRTVRQMEQESA